MTDVLVFEDDDGVFLLLTDKSDANVAVVETGD